jgi:nucleoside-diphosphate-sugar epimerase
MSILIAGFGDLGQAIATQAPCDQHWQTQPILALKRSPPNLTGLPNVSWLGADLSDVGSIEACLASVDPTADHVHTISHVVYCAAPNERTEAAYRRTYLTGLQNLVGILSRRLSAHLAQPRFLFVSSTAVYDSQAQGVFDETSPTEPRGFNGRVLCEAEAWLLTHWPQATVLRLSGIYGSTKQRLLQSIAQGTAHVPDSKDYIANRIHIEDAARAVLHLLQGDYHGIYLGTDSHPVPLVTLYSRLADRLGAPAPKIDEPSPMMGKKRLSNQKLLNTGFTLRWPDCIAGYAAIIEQRQGHASSDDVS